MLTTNTNNQATKNDTHFRVKYGSEKNTQLIKILTKEMYKYHLTPLIRVKYGSEKNTQLIKILTKEMYKYHLTPLICEKHLASWHVAFYMPKLFLTYNSLRRCIIAFCFGISLMAQTHSRVFCDHIQPR